MKAASTLELRRDERGAIVVFGLFASVFLVGAMYMTISIAQTVLQREGLQQAADTSAFAASVVEARGMNMIAAINVLMGALMAILLPLRALAPAYAQVAAMPCLDICSCQIVADAARASAELAQISQSAEQRIGGLFRALSDTQTAIAETVPRLARNAATQAARENGAYLEAPRAETFGPSLSTRGCRLGLPVEEDSFSTTCKRAKVYTSELARRVAGSTLQTMGACKSGPRALAIASPTFPQADTMYCREAAQPPCSAGGGTGGTSPHPKKVFSESKNGSDYMQTWTLVHGKAFDDARAGVEIGAFGDRGSDAPQSSNIAFAQSEIYFDCTGVFATCNQDEQAMYTGLWTARLRRVKEPSISFDGDSVVKNDLASARKWTAERRRLIAARQTAWLDGQSGSEAARLLDTSEEGPLQ